MLMYVWIYVCMSESIVPWALVTSKEYTVSPWSAGWDFLSKNGYPRRPCHLLTVVLSSSCIPPMETFDEKAWRASTGSSCRFWEKEVYLGTNEGYPTGTSTVVECTYTSVNYSREGFSLFINEHTLHAHSAESLFPSSYLSAVCFYCYEISPCSTYSSPILSEVQCNLT